MVEVPGNGLEFDDAKPVPHGTVRVETYHSATLGVPRTVWVYTPPGYDRSTAAYPVFYLLHGAGDSDDEDETEEEKLVPLQEASREESCGCGTFLHPEKNPQSPGLQH